MGFLLRELKAAKKAGIHRVLRKAARISSLGLAVFPLILIRLIRPLVLVRFQEMISSRIAPYVGEADTYLSEHDAGIHQDRGFDIYYNQSIVCNDQLKKMWDRSLRVWQFTEPIGRLNALIPGGKAHTIPWVHRQDRDIFGILQKTTPHINFTAEEETAGQEGLHEIGVSQGAPFVCLHARDSVYLSTFFPSLDKHRFEYRDSTIGNYLPAAEELARRGYFVIRMGHLVNQPLKSSNPMIIDYASNGRTDFLDIYLSSRCAFFICTTSGLEKVPMTFRRPCAYVNYLPLDHLPTWGPKDLCISKRLWQRDEGRYLTLEEIISSDIAIFNHMDLYEENGIEVVENSPEEITDLVIEMDERLNGTWETPVEDEELQNHFWSLYKNSDIQASPRGALSAEVMFSRAGASFLRQNRDLAKVI